MTTTLFSPLDAGSLHCPNRMIMAPMTRGRANADGTPTPIMAEYYALRAEAGLMITEATSISPAGKGWVNAPGIYTDSHVSGWKRVTDAVHGANGRIYLQLWHMGRVSHPDFQDGALPVGPSAIAASGQATTPQGKKPYVVPRAMSEDEIRATVADYASAAGRAIEAGFDGVEIHGANGYLIDQFIRDSSNQRTDSYGGSVENRLRFLREVTEAVVRAVGGTRTGIRLSPLNSFNGMKDSTPRDTFTAAAKWLDGRGLAYLHVLEALPGHVMHVTGERVSPFLRKAFSGTFIVNGGYDRETGEAALAAGEADAIAYGVPFLANPDLVKRYRENAPLNAPDPKTFYTHGQAGYLDYPLLRQAA
jgi:N-ethylmaleimide reductase